MNTADKKQPRAATVTGASQSVMRAIEAVNTAKKLNDQMQAQYKTGTAQWHQCESIDDKLHEALTALGD